MAVLKHYSDNPKDGTTTFDKVRFYRADDTSGTNETLIATVDIDTTTTTAIHPGFTSYVDSAGVLTKYYASSWYNSTSAVETNRSTYVLAGKDRLDTRFENDMQDADEEVFSQTDKADFKKDAIEALYPEFYRDVIDTSLEVAYSSTSTKYIYTVPFGIFSITEVGYGNINADSTTSHDFKTVKPAYWKFEGNQLRFDSLPPWQDGDTIRLVAQKKYLEMGEVPVYLDSLLLLHMKMSAYLKMADDYPRFLKWGQLQNGTKVSFENLRVHAREFERKFNDLKKQIKDSSYATLR